ncbi:MAG: A/G-specific adenine glycosylase [Bacteroidota bacterium]
MKKMTNLIQLWYKKNKRDLPWRKNKNPYQVWVSEIIMQQTRIAQGLHYYHRFLTKFPDLMSLAQAKEDEVLLLWQGLGYYSRARNMLSAARFAYKTFNKGLPTTYQDWLSMTGVGEYTAAAVASICFQEAIPVVDGNVYRVVSRLFGLEEPKGSSALKIIVKKRMEELIDHDNPGDFNQAVMELGALVCTPLNPLCTECPWKTGCLGRKSGMPEKYPVQTVKKMIPELFLVYEINLFKKRTLVRKRGNDSIWRSLYEFPGQEFHTQKSAEVFIKKRIQIKARKKFYKSEWIKHVLTHRQLRICFLEFYENTEKDVKSAELISASIDELNNFPFPVPIINYIAARKPSWQSRFKIPPALFLVFSTFVMKI